MLARFLVAVAAAASVVTAFEVTTPNSDTWWVAGSQNVFAWTCKSADHPDSFTVLLGNNDTSILAASTAIVSVSPNADCSKVLTNDQTGGFNAGTGFTLSLANILNISDIYATSEPFEIKAKGSAYPTTTVIAGASTAASSGTSATGSSTGSAASASPTDNGALKTSVGMGLGAVGAILGLMTF